MWKNYAREFQVHINNFAPFIYNNYAAKYFTNSSIFTNAPKAYILSQNEVFLTEIWLYFPDDGIMD